MTHSLDFLRAGSNPLAYTISALRTCRLRFFPFLWDSPDVTTDDLMSEYRSLAWLVLEGCKPTTKNDLWSACQRALYECARQNGWTRERTQNHKYDQRIRLIGDIPQRLEIPDAPVGLRPSILTRLDRLSLVEVNVLSLCVAGQNNQQIADELSLLPGEVAIIRKEIITKLQEIKACKVAKKKVECSCQNKPRSTQPSD